MWVNSKAQATEQKKEMETVQMSARRKEAKKVVQKDLKMAAALEAHSADYLAKPKELQ